MSSLQVFCDRKELEEWIQLLRAEWALMCLSFTGSTGRGRLQVDIDPLILQDETYRVFLFPGDSQEQVEVPLEMNSVRPRERGWIDVRPGGLVINDSSRRLLLTEIHGEDFEYERVHPARFIRWLRKTLKSKNMLTYGVTGRNLATGGEARYKDIAHTAGALELHHAGVTWAQFPDGRVVFEPI